MHKRKRKILAESLRWIGLRMKYRIDYSRVVLVLSGESKKLDYFALAYLERYVKRKYASEAVVLYNDAETKEMLDAFDFSFPVKAVFYPVKKMEKLYSYYSFEKFFDNIVFTYITEPKDNLLGRVLRETDVNEQDAVCLGLYRLRTVPELNERYVENSDV